MRLEVGTRFYIKDRLFKNQIFTVVRVDDDPGYVGGRWHICSVPSKARNLKSDDWCFAAVSLEFYAERGLLVIEDDTKTLIATAESQLAFLPSGSQINYDIADGAIITENKHETEKMVQNT